MKVPVNHFFALLFLFLFIPGGFSGGIKHPAETNSLIKFTENKNQWDHKILFRAQLDGGVLFLEKNCFTYNFFDKATLRQNHVVKIKNNKHHVSNPIRSHAFRMTFVNAEEPSEIEAKQTTPDYCNFFIGSDKSKWVGNAKNYKEVNYKNIYSGIDLQILGMQNSVKYNFFVAPQANPQDIKLHYEGLDKISIEKKSLRIITSLNEIREEKPYAYQLIDGKIINVPCEFVLENTTVHFAFPYGYDKNYELIIDPILVFACSTGSTADNFGMTATYDAGGNLYAGGTCFDQGYPVTLGAYDPTYNGLVQYARTDVVITKYDSSGTFMQYATYFGGATSTEVVSSLIVNAQNELILLGATGSVDFPITSNAFDPTFNGGDTLAFWANGTEYLNGTDIYVAKFNSTGTGLLASTYIGGSENDGANNSATLVYNYGDFYRGEIQVDNSGNCYIASCTYSGNFPTTAGSPQPLAGGGLDGVVFKMDPNLSTLLWSTYLGGDADDGSYALTLDNVNNVYTTGGTSSINFPTTTGAFSSSYNGGIVDGFITKIKNDGSAILNSTFVGTGFYDQTFLIQLDNNENVYVIGQTEGVMPVSAGVYSNANGKQFIWKLNSNLNSVLISTVFGNSNGQVNISPSAFLVDNCGNIYVCGWGGNILTGVPTANMPLSANAFQATTDGYNFYLFVLSPDASSLLYGTYFGGPLSREHVDGGTSRFDKKGIVYQAVCSGCGGNDDFPVTPGSWPNTGADVNHSWNCNMGVFKFDFQITAGANASALVLPNDTVCLGTVVDFVNTSANSVNYTWNFDDGTPISDNPSPSHLYVNTGTYHIMLIAYDSTGCLFSDTFNITVLVLPQPAVDLGPDVFLCEAPDLILDAGMSANVYLWSTAETTQTISVTSSGTYAVSVSNGTCSATDDIYIQIFPKPALGNDTMLCVTESLTLNTAVPGISYLWSTAETSQGITISSPGQYWVAVDWGVCITYDTINVAYILPPVLSLPPLINLCPNDACVLDPGTNPGTNYFWSTGAETQTIVANLAGIYYVTATNGFCTSTDSTEVIPVPPSVLHDTLSLCNFYNYMLDAGITGSSYLWSTGATAQEINISSSGEYWVTVNWGSCQTSDTSIVDFAYSPVINLPAAINFCSNEVLMLDAGLNPNATYLWSTGESTQAISINSAGIYYVTATNNACSVSDTTVINPIPGLALNNTVALCDSISYTLDAGVTGISYAWSTNETSQSISISVSGQYWVEVNWGNCQTSDTSAVLFEWSPVVDLPSTINFCPDEPVFLDAGINPNATFAWSTAEQTQAIMINSAGTYSVSVSNGACTTMDTSIVLSVPQITLSDSLTLCDTPNYILDAGVLGSSYVWSTGATTASINISSSGQYWVVVDWNSCQSMDTSLISFFASPTVNLPDSAEICPNGTLILDAGNNSGTSYLWSNGAVSQTISVDTGGIYSVVVSNGSCITHDTTLVSVIPEINWKEADTLCTVENFILDAGNFGTSFLWSSGATTKTIPVSEAGTYWVIASTKECTVSDTISIEGSLGVGVLWFPNSFTPDNNGLNDIFTGKGDEITYFHLILFNRWGQVIFETEKQDQGWDGRCKGKMSQQGGYVWKAEYKTQCTKDAMNTKIGHVTLIR